MSWNINLISDTVTKPTQGMLEAMMHAEVGDDVFNEDPTVQQLEDRLAQMFGHEAAATRSGQSNIRLVAKDQTCGVRKYM